jgi:hypothetical protein
MLLSEQREVIRLDLLRRFVLEYHIEQSSQRTIDSIVDTKNNDVDGDGNINGDGNVDGDVDESDDMGFSYAQISRLLVRVVQRPTELTWAIPVIHCAPRVCVFSLCMYAYRKLVWTVMSFDKCVYLCAYFVHVCMDLYMFAYM